MALQTSGAISLNDIHVEAGGTTGTTASVSDSDIRDLISLAADTEADFSDWYGAAAEVDLTSAGLVNGQKQQKQITVSSFISAGGTLVIPSDIWVWSDATGTAALTIDISCTIKNSGKIIGKGGVGGNGSSGASFRTNGAVGGPAIKINSGVTGVTIINNSGAYIAGGGGGGGASGSGSSTAGGGGGAGGGVGGKGQVTSASNFRAGGSAGALNASGGNGTQGNYSSEGVTYTSVAGGGGSGGAGGSRRYDEGNGGAGGGGGRVLAGTGGTVTNDSGFAAGGAGGSAGNAGSTGVGGGGGGWGASGGNSTDGSGTNGGTGGKAINDSSVTYTLTNNGTIYGGT